MRLFKRLSLVTSLFFVGGMLAVILGLSPASLSVAASDTDEEESAWDYISDTEEAVDPSMLSVNIVTASQTNEAQTFGFTARSSVSTYTNRARDKNIYLEVIEEGFSGTIPEVAEGDELPVLKAAVYRIFETKSNRPDVVIPRVLEWDGHCYFHVVAIDGGVFTDYYKNISSILIHDQIETIYSGAFKDVPDDVTINIMHDAAPEGFAEDWMVGESNPTVNWGYTPTSSEIDLLDNTKSSGSHEFASENSFILGYHGDNDEYLPMVATFDVYDADGNYIDTRAQEFPLVSVSSRYDGVGTIKSPDFDFSLSIPLEPGENVDPNSFALHNLFIAQKSSVTDAEGTRLAWEFDLTAPLYYVPAVHFSHIFHINEFFSVEERGLSSFGGKTMVNTFVLKTDDIYADLNPTVYKERKKDIEAGTFSIRTLLTALSEAYYRIEYLRPNGELDYSEISLETPISFCALNPGGDTIGFLFSNNAMREFDPSRIREVSLCNFYVKMDLYNSVEDMILVRSDIAMRFGSLSLYSAKSEGPTPYMNLNMTAIIVAVSYTVIFAIGSVALFFVNTNRFKNDEFRRVVPKTFWKEAAKNFLGFGIVVMAIFFIVGRWGFLNNGIAVVNPFDPLVIAFGIIGLIFVGFSIKNLVTSIKVGRERRRLTKLKINLDVAEDGTN